VRKVGEERSLLKRHVRKHKVKVPKGTKKGARAGNRKFKEKIRLPLRNAK